VLLVKIGFVSWILITTKNSGLSQKNKTLLVLAGSL